VLAIADPIERIDAGQQVDDVLLEVLDHHALGEEARIPLPWRRQSRPGHVLARAAVGIPEVAERQDQLHAVVVRTGQHQIQPTEAGLVVHPWGELDGGVSPLVRRIVEPAGAKPPRTERRGLGERLLQRG
jgi:hypothetical protein